MAINSPKRPRLPTRSRRFAWDGTGRDGRPASAEIEAQDARQARTALLRQGIVATRIRPVRSARGKRIRPRDIAVFTRQLATLLKAGVPLLQSFSIVARGHPNPNVTQLLTMIRADVERGSSLAAAFQKHPQHFNALYCSLIQSGEAAGVLDELLDRLARYMEKVEGIKSKVRSALLYPCAVLLVSLVVIVMIMVLVVPAFKEVFASFGAELPPPTRAVIASSEWLLRWGWLALLALVAAGLLLRQASRRSRAVRALLDRLLLRLPVFGMLLRKSIIARWTRTLSTLFAAGMPLVQALESVAGAAGSLPYRDATRRIQQDVASGASLSTAMTRTRLFPLMVLQMAMIGEESGALDDMLGKSADFYEAEVDDLVAGLSSLMEPIIIVTLGVLIGAIVISMYLPIFQLGQMA